MKKQHSLDQAIERLATMTDQAFQSQVKKWLDCIAKFWNYSFTNTLLIAMQFPNATQVAGMKTWNKLGRKVKIGEKGIAILVPVFAPKADKDKDKEWEEDKNLLRENLSVIKRLSSEIIGKLEAVSV